MPTFFRRFSLSVLSVLAVLAGALFAVSLFAAGLLAMLGITAWSLLRGRRPASVRWRTAGTMRARAAPGDADVVDVVVREVQGPERRLMRD
ncbi:hypothetical protein M8A51_01095 [Schlegelella sp. S2-27]|uniref:DUF58 domain-containing protein n=1 Tax=Caldimonas mangrovi TaxID=2944811 RepID=A0ABT0YHB1_9BURK|nr:hypothetical protein [Caldimonas mangrovi]MCM5678126.1 hypothetical protein [Caldimonas mangrovi]